MELYIVGGRQKKRLVMTVDDERRFESAVIIRLDLNNQTSEQLVDYQTMPEIKGTKDASNLFTSGTLHGDRLYVCTYTEVLIFDTPSFNQVGYFTLPCFNALHHVRPTAKGTLLIVSTGLDMVIETTVEGRVLREWDVMENKVWGKFSRTVDYRKVLSTKPHQSHPNHVFQIGDDVWVTRLLQQYAICLTNENHRISIVMGKPHDGFLHEGKLYFTTVNGHLVEVDPNSLGVTGAWDLKSLCGDAQSILGWCRGLAFVESTKVWVGFTRIRKSSAMTHLNWLKHGLKEVDSPTHISLFDLSARVCLQTIDVERHGINILFSLHPVQKNRTLAA